MHPEMGWTGVEKQGIVLACRMRFARPSGGKHQEPEGRAGNVLLRPVTCDVSPASAASVRVLEALRRPVIPVQRPPDLSGVSGPLQRVRVVWVGGQR